MKTQAIIVTHNNSTTIHTCLQSLQANNIPAIIIDNASTDDTVAQIKSYPHVQLIHSPANLGFAAAANQAAALSSANTLLFLNPDAILPANIQQDIQTVWAKYPQAGIVGFLLCDTHGHPEPQGFGAPVTPLHSFSRKWQSPTIPTQATPVGWVSGGAFIIHRRLWQQLNGFDPQFFLYWEDVDLCLRVNQAGYQVLLLPTIKVTHQKGASFTNNGQKTQIYDQSADRYFRKHYAFPIWGILHLMRRFYRLLGYQAK